MALQSLCHNVRLQLKLCFFGQFPGIILIPGCFLKINTMAAASAGSMPGSAGKLADVQSDELSDLEFEPMAEVVSGQGAKLAKAFPP